MWTSLKQTGVCWYVRPSILANWRHANMRYPVPGNKGRRSIACPVMYASSDSGDETSTSTELAKLLADVAENWSAVGTRQLSEWSQCTSDDNIGVLGETGNSTGGYNAIVFTLTPFTYSLWPQNTMSVQYPSLTIMLWSTVARFLTTNTTVDLLNPRSAQFYTLRLNKTFTFFIFAITFPTINKFKRKRLNFDRKFVLF